MPTNLYGPNDNFDLETSHVMPVLIRKFHEEKMKSNQEVVVGAQEPHVGSSCTWNDDGFMVHLMENYDFL
ncbi:MULTISPECIES: NAD-dependent epimerase/dehydratase family protein [unclassified Methanosarcina]|uniref:NAD-dependent epimerase/dehydratase family protein n=1 Tax=unclassified Methanosarcina TaxID=2644672 RepID=UPI000AC48BBB|nr:MULTISPECIES: NAD-dependent epimerase/dehydratase family protein [unclassified Methanosarcina]